MDASDRTSAIDLVPDFGRYSSAVRRLWRLTVLPAAVLAAAATYLVSSTDGGATAVKLSVDQLDHQVPNTRTPLGFVPPRRTVAEQADAIGSDEVWQRIAKSNPAARRPSFQVNEAAGVLTVSIPGSAAAATATVAGYVDELRTVRRQAIEEAAKVPVAVGRSLESALTDEIGSLQPANGTASPAIDAGIAFQRAELVRKRAEVREDLAIVSSTAEGSSAGVQLLSSTRTTVAKVPRAVFAGLGGALLALVAVLLMAFTDRRVRRRVDVERALGPGAFVGSLQQGWPSPQVVSLAAALQGLVENGGSVGLVGVGTYDTSPLAEALQPGPTTGPEVRVFGGPGLDSDGSAIGSARSADAAVLVLAAGSVSEQELAGAAHALAKAGGVVRGVVLVDTSVKPALVAG